MRKMRNKQPNELVLCGTQNPVHKPSRSNTIFLENHNTNANRKDRNCNWNEPGIQIHAICLNALAVIQYITQHMPVYQTLLLRLVGGWYHAYEFDSKYTARAQWANEILIVVVRTYLVLYFGYCKRPVS